MRRLSILATLIGGALLSGLSWQVVALEPASEATASQWLKEMAISLRNRNYDGVLVSNRGGKMRSVRVVHIVRDGMESERLEYLDGESVEVQRGQHPVDCIHSGKQLLSHSDDSGLFGAYASQGGAAHNGALRNGIYQLEVQPGSRVAGRAVEVIAVRPNDAHRYAHRMFLDVNSQLLLKSQVLDQQENVLESFQFTQISIDDEVDQSSIETASGATVKEKFHALPIGIKAVQLPWRLAWLPPGFVAASQRSSAAESVSSEFTDLDLQSMHFTDGFALFSVFLQPRDSEVEAFETRIGSTLAYVAPKKLQQGWASVTVVGELPLATAVQIAQSLEEMNLTEASADSVE